ncbi:MAG: YybS family protein [Proteobacteria bacterium]|nr:YybS family protein [Pseudomonadota bacterium]
MFSGSGAIRQTETISAVAITALVFTVPAVFAGLEWLHCLMPLPAYYFLCVYGKKQGSIIIAWALGIAGGMTFWTGSVPSLFFSLALLPVGYILAGADRNNESVQLAGIKSIAYLVLVWLMTAGLIGMATQSNPYLDLRHSLDTGLEATFAMYRDSGRFPAEDLEHIKTFIVQLREQVARLFPALLLISVICTVWLNTVVGHWLLKRKDPSRTNREDFKSWRLPELLVWPAIIAGVALLIPHETLNDLGLNGGLVLLVLYFSQGLAVVSSMMQKWSLPTAIRVITYILLFLQVYGIAFVAVLGLVDVWADFRKQRLENDVDDTSVS